ncbi:AraC family transcriptional regulator [Klebsiella indica]|nr:AraC family transcriptional regulator [Klebsiella indica]
MSQLTSALKPKGIHPLQPHFVACGNDSYKEHVLNDDRISHFYTFKVTGKENQTLAVPDGCTDIVFDCDEHSRGARICGTTLTTHSTEFKAGHEYFGVRFLPGIVPGFSDLSAEDLADKEINILDSLSNAQNLIEEITSCTSFMQRTSLFQSKYAPHLIRDISDITKYMIQTIQQCKGDIRIEELQRLTGYSCRTIQRMFRQDTGLSPKTFCRLIRFQIAIGLISTNKKLSLSSLSLDLGYSDQSHFLREFKSLSNMTPGEYKSYASNIKLPMDDYLFAPPAESKNLSTRRYGNHTNTLL